MNAETTVIQISLQDWQELKAELAELRRRVARLEGKEPIVLEDDTYDDEDR
jgi:hypothetical protein